VQVRPLDGQQVVGAPLRLAMQPAVDRAAQRGAGRLELGEAAVGGAQVGVGRHQVGLGDAHRRLAAALRFGIELLLGVLDHPRVAHRRGRDGGVVTAELEISCPSAGRSLAA
jgi:hypothetical protein